jgi:hypothetical protein
MSWADRSTVTTGAASAGVAETLTVLRSTEIDGSLSPPPPLQPSTANAASASSHQLISLINRFMLRSSSARRNRLPSRRPELQARSTQRHVHIFLRTPIEEKQTRGATELLGTPEPGWRESCTAPRSNHLRPY